MNTLEKIILGKSKLKITRIGFGGIPIARLEKNNAVSVVREAIDIGFNWIDTAHVYGNSEEVIGEAIKNYDRQNICIFTKSTAREPVATKQQISLSLSRIGTKYIDAFQFHDVPNVDVWREMLSNGTLDTVRRYRDRGVIRHIGASAHSEKIALTMIDHPEVEILQYPFNFIVEDEGRRVIEACREKNVGFIAMKPFGGGLLEKASACIRFILQFPDIVTDPGFEQIKQVREVARLYIENAPLSSADRQHISAKRDELGKTFCRRCGYCSPCPEGVQIILLMTMESFIKRFSLKKLSTWPVKAAESSQKCVECGECEKKCPYHLPIMMQIKKNAAMLRRTLEIHS
jgi:predicted aldo/keto reductase-like oxidoreductase